MGHQQREEEIRKGPWTEQEDFQLVCFVGLFGDRRWDFIAKVSGLNRTGKSCRLRWVNYLHPGLKRGKMTPHEERLVLELHAKWGNRWSRIARKLPGRTDNEIKNYWRTHMRKKAQEKKRANTNTSPASPSSSSSSSNITTVESLPFPDSTTGVQSFYDTGGKPHDNKTDTAAAAAAAAGGGGNYYSMDDIWKEISLPEVNNIIIEEPMMYGATADMICNDVVEELDQFYCSDSLWKMDDDEASKPLFVNYNSTIFSAGFDHGYGASTESTLTSVS